MHRDRVFQVLLAIAVILFLFHSCSEFLATSNKRLPKVKIDTIVLKSDTIVVRDTIKETRIKKLKSVIHDTITRNNIQIIIRDSIVTKDSSIYRDIQVSKSDTIIRDTVFITKNIVDTIYLKRKGNFKLGLGIGYVLGVATVSIIPR
jgi:hypothetical protein